MGKDRVYGQFQSNKIDHHKLSLGATEEATWHINSSGSDSGSSPYDIYFDFGRPAISVNIRVTVACTLTEWNGQALKSPLTLNPGSNEIKAGCSSFKVVTTSASVVEVTIK